MHIKFGVVFRYHYVLVQSIQGCTCFLFMNINTENYTSLSITYILASLQQPEELLNTAAEKKPLHWFESWCQASAAMLRMACPQKDTLYALVLTNRLKN